MLLNRLRHQDGDGPGLRAFIQILKLHQTYPAPLIEVAIEEALQLGCLHADGVRLCLHHLLHPEQPHPRLDLTSQPHLAALGAQPITLDAYETLLTGGAA